MSRAAAGLAALAALACAGAPAKAARFTFPEAFDANQLVTVRAADGSRELLASLRRRGEHYQVTLFDPVLALPMMSASTDAGGAAPEGVPEELREGHAARLLSLLKDLYGRTFHLVGADAAEARAGAFTYRLSGIRPRDACLFPEAIEVAGGRGAPVEVRVTTLDLSCRVGRGTLPE